MGEKADASDHDEGDDEGRVLEWEIGLPIGDDLTPLSQFLVPPVLASAFGITAEPARTLLDVHRASHNTLSALRRLNSAPSSTSSNSSSSVSVALESFPHFSSSSPANDPMVLDGASAHHADPPPIVAPEEEAEAEAEAEADSSTLRLDNSNDELSVRTLKRPRLVWTPQLHKRFVDVVGHLGVKSAVPKTIMQLMNVEGLTRENVASHLQKYRLYVKRMQQGGLSNEGPSPSDHLFASTPVPPQSLHERPQPVPSVAMPMPCAVPTMIPMPVFSMPHHNGSPVGMVPVNNHQGSPAGYHGFELHHPYEPFGKRPKDWSGGNNYGSIVSRPRVSPNDK